MKKREQKEPQKAIEEKLGHHAFVHTQATLRFPSCYESLCIDLAQDFLRRGHMPLETFSNVRMVGLLFARPNTKFATDEIVPNLEYFHRRSGDHISLYCAGFRDALEIAIEENLLRQGTRSFLRSAPPQSQTAPPDGPLRFYSDDRFDFMRKQIEKRTQWRYSGGADLILTNAKFNGKTARLDFATTISADLVKMKADGAITGVDAFFEQIFRYAETQAGNDPTWGFSDSLGSVCELPWGKSLSDHPFKKQHVSTTGGWILIPPNLPALYVNQWNLSIQRQVGARAAAAPVARDCGHARALRFRRLTVLLKREGELEG